MKVRQEILDKINNPQARMRIAQKLQEPVTEQAVAVQFRRNTPGGRLTKMDCLQAIAEEAGCSVEDILEPVVSRFETQN